MWLYNVWNADCLPMVCWQACSMLALVKYVIKIRDKGVTVGDELAALYAGELNPVAAKAQRKVPVPEGWVGNWTHLPCHDGVGVLQVSQEFVHVVAVFSLSSNAKYTVHKLYIIGDWFSD